MKYTFLTLIVILFQLSFCRASETLEVVSTDDTSKQEELNKRIALKFYEDLWMTNNTDRYLETVADEYVVHDRGNRKGVIEPAREQKITADRFWGGGQMDFKPEWQIAEGDLVATKWKFNYKAESFMSKIMIGTNEIHGINVFRIKDGKIVEIWNHRHDLDANAPVFFLGGKGFLLGLLVSVFPVIMAIRYKRKLNHLSQ